MREVLQKVGNGLLILGGFLVVFFGVQRASDQKNTGATLSNIFHTGEGVAYADVPAGGADSSCADSFGGGGGDSACSGDGGADGGADSGGDCSGGSDGSGG